MPVHQIPNSKKDNWIATRIALTLVSLYALALIPYHEYRSHYDQRQQLVYEGCEFWKKRSYEKSQEKFQEALNLSTGCLANDLTQAKIRHRLTRLSKWHLSEKDMILIDKIYQKELGPTHFWTLDLASMRIGDYRLSKQYAKADAIAQYELAYLGPIDSIDNMSAFTFLESLVLLYRDEDRPQLALNAGLAAQRLVIHHAENFEYILELNELAHLHQELGQFEESRILLERELSLLRKNWKEGTMERDFEPHIYSDLGLVYAARGDNKPAEFLFKQGVSLQEKIYGTNSPLIGYRLSLLLDFYIRTKQLEKAGETLDKLATVYAIEKATFTKDLSNGCAANLARRREQEICTYRRDIQVCQKEQNN